MKVTAWMSRYTAEFKNALHKGYEHGLDLSEYLWHLANCNVVPTTVTYQEFRDTDEFLKAQKGQGWKKMQGSMSSYTDATWDASIKQTTVSYYCGNLSIVRYRPYTDRVKEEEEFWDLLYISSLPDYEGDDDDYASEPYETYY